MLLTEDRDRVRIITFDRPESLNAFNQQLYGAAADALDAAALDDGVAVVVLTGAGRAFSAGQDLFEMSDIGRSQVDGEPGPNKFPAFVRALSTFPKPLVAAVNGVGVGIGFTMLAHCDLVLIARGARLRTPFTSLGVAPEAASSYLFPRRMGWQRAAWVLFSSAWISAEDAVAAGMAWRVCEPDALLADTLEVAGTIARMPVSSLMATKRLLLESQIPAVNHARDLEDAAFAELLGGPASREALQAFAEKRDPDFTNLPG
ncbi:MAG: enoyl-CoA hydratase/isomerase family protein [Acidimicrobiales bacterium]